MPGNVTKAFKESRCLALDEVEGAAAVCLHEEYDAKNGPQGTDSVADNPRTGPTGAAAHR
jgi:hypothetical protein